MTSRREQLRALYGFDFPDDFFHFWEFAKRLRPLEPLNALRETLDITLVGPFEVLAGRFDGHTPRYSQLLHWRYYDDPPEFFTVFAGGGDGLHWGYYLDDPPRAGGCIAHYYARDVFEFEITGETLFEAVRYQLEDAYANSELDLSYGLEEVAEHEARCQSIDDLRDRLRSYDATGEEATGETYLAATFRTSQRRIVAATREQMGIVVPPEKYRRLSLIDEKLWSHLRKVQDPIEIVEEARQALRDGYPGTALKLGKDLWAAGGEHQTMYAYELLDAAYAALGRDVLRQVLRTHRENRDLPSVDILLPDGMDASGELEAP